MVSLVQCHWIVGPRLGHWPRADDFHPVSIDNRDVPRPRHVDEDSTARSFELERLGMPRQFHSPQDGRIRRTNRGKRSASVSHVKPLRVWIVPDVVGIVTEPNRPSELIIVLIQQLDTAALTVCNGDNL